MEGFETSYNHYKNSPYEIFFKPSPVKHIKNSSSSVEKLPDVNNPQSTSPNKLSSVERIANRLQQESKKRPLMNIDREYNDLKKILESKQTEREQKLYKAHIENVSSSQFDQFRKASIMELINLQL